MMKGLFNYETALRDYTEECLKEFVRENVQYAEIRPNFMPSNQIFFDDGIRYGQHGKKFESRKRKFEQDNPGKIYEICNEKFDENEATMDIIIDAYEKFMEENRNKTRTAGGQLIDRAPGSDHRPVFSGLKVIYCTPRSSSLEEVHIRLQECLKWKKDPKYGQYIAGFDLVGPEAAEKHPLSYFKKILEQFQKDCRVANVDVPFLFHCGETEHDSQRNLATALDLDNVRRLGHGYALDNLPDQRREIKDRNICIESCPISNEILGLNWQITQHPIYNLVSNGIHCTINSDNGTLFQ
jgi:adenosine deaminase CECR1